MIGIKILSVGVRGLRFLLAGFAHAVVSCEWVIV